MRWLPYSFLLSMFIMISCAIEGGKGNSYPVIENYSPKKREMEVEFMSMVQFSLKCKDRETPDEEIVYKAYLNGAEYCDSESKTGSGYCNFINTGFFEETGIQFSYTFGGPEYDYEVKLTCTDKPVGPYPANTVEKVWKIKVRGLQTNPYDMP